MNLCLFGDARLYLCRCRWTAPSTYADLQRPNLEPPGDFVERDPLQAGPLVHLLHLLRHSPAAALADPLVAPPRWSDAWPTGTSTRSLPQRSALASPGVVTRRSGARPALLAPPGSFPVLVVRRTEVGGPAA